tara:strand:+ start:73 stop:456 length:384 start_codon:yes stop_codon:yes gene_type:complete
MSFQENTFNIYQLILKDSQLPISCQYFRSVIVSSRTEKEAREYVNSTLNLGLEKNLDLGKVKELFIPLDTFIEKGGTFSEHTKLKYLDYGYLEDNHIWENEEFVNIKKIGISLSTNNEIHSKIFIRA